MIFGDEGVILKSTLSMSWDAKAAGAWQGPGRPGHAVNLTQLPELPSPAKARREDEKARISPCVVDGELRGWLETPGPPGRFEFLLSHKQAKEDFKNLLDQWCKEDEGAWACCNEIGRVYRKLVAAGGTQSAMWSFRGSSILRFRYALYSYSCTSRCSLIHLSKRQMLKNTWQLRCL